VPRWVRAIVARGLRAAPSARWPSMAAVVRALEREPAVTPRRLSAQLPA
jgi:hypothetical protein